MINIRFLPISIVGLSSLGMGLVTACGVLSDKQSLTTESSELVAYRPYAGQYPNFTLVIDERFDQFDSQLWSKGDGAFGETNCRFQAQGVQINNGEMQLVIRKEAIPESWSVDHQNVMPSSPYSCGELRSKAEYLYGRFEARIRTPHPNVASGYISSLFTFRNKPSENYQWREIDVELEGMRPTKFQSNLILGQGTYNWSDTRLWGAFEQIIEIGETSQWKVYAVEWTPDSIKWFVDGQLVRVLDRGEVAQKQHDLPHDRKISIPDLPAQIMMNFWIPNPSIAPVFGGPTDRNQYPLVAQYDWFRYYAYTPGANVY
ncbi:MAG: family 16 glycosylhydrolase [Oligoflexus sp.]